MDSTRRADARVMQLGSVRLLAQAVFVEISHLPINVRIHAAPMTNAFRRCTATSTRRRTTAPNEWRGAFSRPSLPHPLHPDRLQPLRRRRHQSPRFEIEERAEEA